MKNTRNALVEHLSAAKNTLEIRDVKKYQGELGDIEKAKGKLPGVFLLWESTAKTKNMCGKIEFALLVVSRNDAFNNIQNADDNAELTSNVLDWILKNYRFEDNTAKYEIGNGFQNTEEPNAQQLVDTNEFAVSQISITVYKYAI